MRSLYILTLGPSICSLSPPPPSTPGDLKDALAHLEGALLHVSSTSPTDMGGAASSTGPTYGTRTVLEELRYWQAAATDPLAGMAARQRAQQVVAHPPSSCM